jgi:hypothetical protein
MKAGRGRDCAAAFALGLGLWGCNAVLGIHSTEGPEWDGGAALTSNGSSNSSSQDSGSYVNPTMNGDGSVPPPADAGVIPTWANWPVPNPPSTQLPNPQVYDTSVTGIVRDTVTHLEWQTSIDGVTRTFNEAVMYCATLPDKNGGWRLPSRMELFSILDYTQYPGITAASFGPLPPGDGGSERYWSSSLKAGDITAAWTVEFGSSVDLVLPVKLNELWFVRCVRGGS